MCNQEYLSDADAAGEQVLHEALLDGAQLDATRFVDEDATFVTAGRRCRHRRR